MTNKYFGTDGIRGTVNQGNITGEKFFKFGLASATYFKNQKKNKTNSDNCKRYKTIWLYFRASFSFWTCFSRDACLYSWTITNKWTSDAYKKNESQSWYYDNCISQSVYGQWNEIIWA